MEDQLIDWSAAVVAARGETVSGDMYLIRHFSGGVLVAAVDGLGHGPEAAASAQAAIDLFDENCERPLDWLFRSCHEALKLMRGAVISLARFNKPNSTITWMGVGNVEGRLMRANPGSGYEILLLRGGIVGHTLPPLITDTIPVRPGDTLIFASDGIRSDFAENLDVKASPQQLVSNILNQSAKNIDDSLVVVARYL